MIAKELLENTEKNGKMEGGAKELSTADEQYLKVIYMYPASYKTWCRTYMIQEMHRAAVKQPFSRKGMQWWIKTIISVYRGGQETGINSLHPSVKKRWKPCRGVELHFLLKLIQLSTQKSIIRFWPTRKKKLNFAAWQRSQTHCQRSENKPG